MSPITPWVAFVLVTWAMWQHVSRPGFLAPHVGHDLRLAIRHDDMHVHRARLPEAVTAANRLVVGLVRVSEPEEGHPRAVLKVEPESCDARLCHEDARVAANEGH